MSPQLRRLLEARIRTPRTLERVLRLNDGITPGMRLRGFRKEDGRAGALCHAWMPKGEFIRRHGRAVFDALPHAVQRRNGRRIWVAMETDAALGGDFGHQDPGETVRALLALRLMHRSLRYRHQGRLCYAAHPDTWIPLYRDGRLITGALHEGC